MIWALFQQYEDQIKVLKVSGRMFSRVFWIFSSTFLHAGSRAALIDASFEQRYPQNVFTALFLLFQGSCDFVGLEVFPLFEPPVKCGSLAAGNPPRLSWDLRCIFSPSHIFNRPHRGPPAQEHSRLFLMASVPAYCAIIPISRC